MWEEKEEMTQVDENLAYVGMEMDLYQSGDSAENRSFSLCSWLWKIEVFRDQKSSGGDEVRPPSVELASWHPF